MTQKLISLLCPDFDHYLDDRFYTAVVLGYIWTIPSLSYVVLQKAAK